MLAVRLQLLEVLLRIIPRRAVLMVDVIALLCFGDKPMLVGVPTAIGQRMVFSNSD